MGRLRALPMLLGGLAGLILLSGATGADPRTPPPLPGKPAPFLGTAVIGSGGLLGAVDSYGNLVELRFPGPAGDAQIVNPFARQAAGTVPARTGIVPAVAAGRGRRLPLWRADRVHQRYVPGTNVLLTRAQVGGAAILIEDAAAGGRLVRKFTVRGHTGQRLSLRLGVHLAPSAAIRCRGLPATLARAAGAGRLTWQGRGTIRAAVLCSASAERWSPAGAIRAAAAGDRRWLAARRPLGPAPGWARRAYVRSLFVLRALSDRRSGAMAAAARDRWAYVWPRDAGTAAIALADSGYRPLARRIVSFLTRLDLGAGARFRADGSPVADGRELPGDAAGWVAAAARAGGIAAPRPIPGAWRQRGDYGERDGDRGDYLANAVAGGATAAEIRELFASARGLERRAADPGSGLDSAAAWAVLPFPRPPLFELVRRTLLRVKAGAGRFGVTPSEDWPHPQAWTAPAAWSAWSLAALGERSAALRLLATLRRATTPTGTIPERVGMQDGLPRSATPLGWTHAFALLALRELYPR